MTQNSSADGKLSFDTFVQLRDEAFGDSKVWANDWNMYKTFMHFTPRNAAAALRSSAEATTQSHSLNHRQQVVPHLKHREYLEHVMSNVGSHCIHSKPIDSAGSMHLLLFDRLGQKELGGGKRVFQDSLHFEPDESDFVVGQRVGLHNLKAANELNGQFGLLGEFDVASKRWRVKLDSGDQKSLRSQNLKHEDHLKQWTLQLLKAFQHIAPITDVVVEYDGSDFKEFIRVRSPKDIAVLSRLILPSFVHWLQDTLKCEAKDELIVVPFCKDALYATKSSSFLGCCMLGDYCDALGAHEEIADWNTSVPYRIKSMDRSTPEMDLIAKGVFPVVWEYYPLWGGMPLVGLAQHGRVRFPVPGSTQQADEFLAKRRAGAKVCVLATAVDDGHSLVGVCACCFQSQKLSRCSSCALVAYCSRDCQKQHWALHKHQCCKK